MALSTRAVHQRLRGAAQKLRWSRSVRYTLTGVALAMLSMLICLLLDSRFHFDALGRWVSFMLVMVPLAFGAALTMWAWRPTVSEERIARRIESRSSLRGNVLISAVQFDRELAADSPLRRALFEEMQDPFPVVRWSNVFDGELLKRLALVLGGVALGIGLCALIMPRHFANSAARIILPGSDIAPLTRTQILEVSPGTTRIVHGRDLTVSVKLGGEIPNMAWIYFREVGSSWRKEAMNREVGLPMFHYRWGEVRQSMDFYIVAGDVRSAIHRVTVRPATAVSARVAEVELPAYTRAPKAIVKDFTVLQNVLPGSRVTVNFDFNYPVAQARAIDDKGQTLAAEKVSDTAWRFSERLMANRNITLNFRDTDDISNSDSLQVVVKPDEPPKLDVTEPAEGKQLIATRDSTVEIRFTAKDNFGLGAVTLYRSTAESEQGQVVQDWKDAVGKPRFEATAKVALGRFVTTDERLTFCVVAKDQNDVTGPGVTVSRPIVVTLAAPEQVKAQRDDAAKKLQQALEEMIRLQRTNIEESRGALRIKQVPADSIQPLQARQNKIWEMGRTLLATADAISPKVREDLRLLTQREMREAVEVLRSAVAAPDAYSRGKFVTRGVELMVAILARLQGAPEAAASAATKKAIEEALSGVEALLRKQRDLFRDTNKAAPAAAKQLSERQDALADESVKVRKGLENAPKTDQELAARLQKAAAMFGEFKIYEEMLGTAEKLGAAKFQPAADAQKAIIINLAKILAFINEWQLSKAGADADKLRKTLEDLKAKLARLEALQRDIVEKSKDMARKDQLKPEDQATAKEIQNTKDLMTEVLEQMLTDAHVFPDMKPSNEMRGELVSMFEDVIQQDKEQAEKGELKPQEIAVQKEEGLLAAIEQAEKIAEDMEMWLPNKNETQKWLMENFDKTEFPEIPNLPLPDVFEDMVGNLLQEQENLGQQVEDAASNNLMAQNPANGWEVRDGPMPGYGAQGRTGNERPEKMEQSGRSSGGREGMSTGEMVGDTAKKLEGSSIDTRRTQDPFQQGMVKDESGPSEAKATGGGKAGAFSDRQGMEGNAPLRSSNAPKQMAADALAVQQALLAQKAAKTMAQAQLFYLRADGVGDASRLMEQAQWALKTGRIGDYKNLHQRIVRQLQTAKGDITGGKVLELGGNEPPRGDDKQLLGGSEGGVPNQYKDMVAEYYRSLAEVK